MSPLEYIKNRLVEKTTQASIATAVAGFIADQTGMSEGMIGPLEQIVVGIILLLVAVLPSPKIDTNKAKSPLTAFMLVMVLLMLSACAGAVPWNKQMNAGLSEWKVELCDLEGKNCVKGSFIDGKESEEKQLAVQLTEDIIIKYSTAGERAFEGLKTRADVEKFLSEQVGNVAPSVVDAFAAKLGIVK